MGIFSHMDLPKGGFFYLKVPLELYVKTDHKSISNVFETFSSGESTRVKDRL